MPTILVRPRHDGSTGYTARIHIRKNKTLIHQESMTYSTRGAALKWGKRREVELEDPEVLKLAMHGETTLSSLIRWYVDCFQNISKWQRSKQSALRFLEKHEIGKVDALKLTAERLVDHVRARRASGVTGATAANDLTWISIILETAKAARGTPVNLSVVIDARIICHKLRLISRGRRRDRRPTTEELQKLDQYFYNRDRHPCSIIPMRTMMWFAIESGRREAEICRLEWNDNDATTRTGLVRDAKHPRNRDGNHLRFKYTRFAWEIVQQQPRRGRYIFPYDPKSVSVAFTDACRMLGIDDLTFHDLRHEATSRLFELGYEIHEVAQFTLHRSWEELKRYTNLRPENLREIIILENGDRIVQSAPVKIKTLPSPPASELVPPTTRASRSPLFSDDVRIARIRRRNAGPALTPLPPAPASIATPEMDVAQESTG